jgi:hypothetical protein
MREGTVTFLTQLGFIVNERKSTLTPSHTCQFLGFIFISKTMTLSLSLNKQLRTQALLSSFSLTNRCKIRDFAKLTSILCSICPTIRYGWVYTKRLEHAKSRPLKGALEIIIPT